MSDLLRNSVLVAATLAMGLAAGHFYTFAIPVMSGPARSSDRTFVEGVAAATRDRRSARAFCRGSSPVANAHSRRSDRLAPARSPTDPPPCSSRPRTPSPATGSPPAPGSSPWRWLAWQRELGVDLDRVNVHGGAIALGHPLGASGARLTATMLGALERTGGRYGLQVMCEAGGQAMILERLT